MRVSQKYFDFLDQATKRIAGFLLTTVLISAGSIAFAGGKPSVQTPEQLQIELTSIANESKNGIYEILKKAGWKLPEFGDLEEPWPHHYLVAKKGNVFGVIVTQGTKTNQISRYGVPYYNYRGGAKSAFVLADIPPGHVPVIGCVKVSDWEETGRRCVASKGTDCSVNTASPEMIAFVRMPNQCAQESSLLHSAFRYSEQSPLKLQPVPTAGMHCLVESYRAKHCPVLTD